MTAFKFFLVSLLLLRPASAQKVVPLSLCQQTDPFTGMPSSAPFLIAQQVRYFPASCDMVCRLLACFRKVATAFIPQPPTRQENPVQALLIQMLSVPQTHEIPHQVFAAYVQLLSVLISV